MRETTGQRRLETVRSDTSTWARIEFRTPVTIEQIERVNAQLERYIDEKLEAARRLHRLSKHGIPV